MFVFPFLLFIANVSAAAGYQYDLRVDGLACPFCAYGIEKKIINTEGVTSIDFDLVKGLVIVKTSNKVSFTEPELKIIIHDAGFTLKSMTKKTM